MKPAIFAALPLVALLTACAEDGAGYTPILDGPHNAAFQGDLRACQKLAKDQPQFDQETIAAALIGAGVGAIIADLEDQDVVDGAIAGSVIGGTASAVEATQRRKDIVIECLRIRGHRVVG